MNHSESIPTKKIFWPKFFDFVIFSLFCRFGRKTTKSHEKKFYRGKIFWFRDFRFEIRFKPFWIDSDQKNFFDQNFLPLSFFHYFGHFGRKTTKSHEKNFTREKIFDFEIFVLKYVSKHSESIPTKKIFSTKIFWLCHFFTILVILAEKRLSPTKKILHGKKFLISRFSF